MALSGPSKSIACLTKNGNNPAYEGARIGVRRIAKVSGYEVDSAYPAKPDDPVEQESQLREFLAAKPDALLVAPAHPSALDGALSEARHRGIPVVSFVSRSENIAPDCFVTSDNRQLAEAIADHLIAHLGGTGKIAIIEGNPASETSAPRTEGFRAAIARASGIELVATEVGGYQRDLAAQRMEKILTETPDLDGVLVANDFMALGVIDVMKARGSTAAVVSINAMPQAIAALKSGDLLATSAFDAMKIACIATTAAIRLIEGQTVPRNITLPVDIVTASNCGPYELEYQKRPLPTWEDVVGE